MLRARLGTPFDAAGVSSADSVLDPQGECWEVAGLYCCDGSTFPTPTGERWALCCSAATVSMTEARLRAGVGAAMLHAQGLCCWIRLLFRTREAHACPFLWTLCVQG